MYGLADSPSSSSRRALGMRSTISVGPAISSGMAVRCSTNVGAEIVASWGVRSIRVAASSIARAGSGRTEARNPRATRRAACSGSQPIHAAAAVSVNRLQSRSIRLSSAWVCGSACPSCPRAKADHSTRWLTLAGCCAAYASATADPLNRPNNAKRSRWRRWTTASRSRSSASTEKSFASRWERPLPRASY